jgi:hypothetical protein
MYDRTAYACKVKQSTLDGLDKWAQLGIPVGSFLEAVLTNDLKRAMFGADDENREAIFDIVSYAYNELPSGCWGSPERVAAWYEMKLKEREAKNEGQ